MKSIPASSKRFVALSLFLAITVALPMFVWTALNVNFNLNKKAQGEPNFCGGTCGSNFNCQANLFCYQGFCRNPICSDDTDCVCNTTTPTSTPKATISAIYTKTALPSPTSSPISKGGNITPEPTAKTTPTPAEINNSELTDDEQEIENQILNRFASYTIATSIFLGLIVIISLIIYFTKGKKTNIPHIVPPQNI